MVKDAEIKPFEKLLDALRKNPKIKGHSSRVYLNPERLIVRRHSDILVLALKKGERERRLYIKRLRIKKNTRDHRIKLVEKIRREYETAKWVYENFSYESQFGVLNPIAYFDEEFALVTEECQGSTLRSLLPSWFNIFNGKNKLNSAAPYCRLAGQWLRRFHELDLKNQRTSIPLDSISNSIFDRIQKLKSIHRSLDPGLEEKIREYVERTTKSVRGDELKAVVMHGDFCPANMLIFENKLTVIDFSTAGVGSVYHDLSHFLFHLNGLERYPLFSNDQISQLKKEFLEGYGQSDINNLMIFPLMMIHHSVCRLLSIAKKYNSNNLRNKLALNWQLRYHISTLKNSVQREHGN